MLEGDDGHRPSAMAAGRGRQCVVRWGAMGRYGALWDMPRGLSGGGIAGRIRRFATNAERARMRVRGEARLADRAQSAWHNG